MALTQQATTAEPLSSLDDELRSLIAIYDRGIDSLERGIADLKAAVQALDDDEYRRVGRSGVAQARLTLAVAGGPQLRLTGLQTRRCPCGNPIGPNDRWCSHSCYLDEVGFDEPHDELADPDDEGPF